MLCDGDGWHKLWYAYRAYLKPALPVPTCLSHSVPHVLPTKPACQLRSKRKLNWLKTRGGDELGPKEERRRKKEFAESLRQDSSSQAVDLFCGPVEHAEESQDPRDTKA